MSAIPELFRAKSNDKKSKRGESQALNKARLEQAEKIAHALAAMKMDDADSDDNTSFQSSPLHRDSSMASDASPMVNSRQGSLETDNILSPKSSRAFSAGQDWQMVQVISPEDVNKLVLNQGAIFVKHGRLGVPHHRKVWLSADCTKICWQDMDGKHKVKTMEFLDCSSVHRGKSTGVFQRHSGDMPPPPDELCLSIISSHRSLDLVAADVAERDFWYEQLSILVENAQKIKIEGSRDADQRRKEDRLTQRKTDWIVNILPNWDKLFGTPKLGKIVMEGVPPSIRADCWPKAIGNPLQITPDLYNIFKNTAKQTKERPIDSTQPHAHSLDVLEKDLPRTFASLGFFHNGGPMEEALREVLETYIFYRPDIGYVQGMSFVAAMLLLYMDAYPAFLCMANMLHSHYFLSFLRMDLKQIKIRFAVYEAIFEEQIPSLSKQFKDMEITPEIYLLGWLLTLYTKCVPLDTASRIWDNYLYEGETFMIRTALGILHYLMPQIEGAPFEDIVELLTHLPQDIEADVLFQAIEKFKVSKATFDSLLNEARRQSDIGQIVCVSRTSITKK